MLAGYVRRLIALATFATLLAPALAWAQEGPTSLARYFAPAGYRPKEFTFMRADGWFHVFYLRENLIPGAPTQRSFGHAISRDLYTWTELDTILPVVEGTFEGTQVWEPSLHRIAGTYYLFYPGVRDEPELGYHLAQSITFATSPDLYTWTRRETPLFGNEIFPWAFVDSTSTVGRECRDPFLWWDSASNEWLLYVATRPAFRPQSMVIGIAGSTDLEHWEDRGYVPITLPNVSFSDVAESPHLFTRDGSTLYILWTTNAGQQLTYGTSTNALAGWGGSRRLRAMLGYSTIGWWGSEVIEADGRTYFANMHTSWIDFWDLAWTAPDSFALAPPDTLQIFGAQFDRDSAAVGDTVAIRIAAIHAAGRSIQLTYFAPDSSDAALDPVALGLPASVVLEGDTTLALATVALPEAVPSLRVAMRAQGCPPESVSVLSLQAPDPPPPDPDPFAPEDPTEDPIPTRTRAIVRFSGEVRFERANAARGFCARVYDVRGREVWADCAAPGTRALVWRPDRSGAGGAGPGIYFARIEAPGERSPERLKFPMLRSR